MSQMNICPYFLALRSLNYYYCILLFGFILFSTVDFMQRHAYLPANLIWIPIPQVGVANAFSMMQQDSLQFNSMKRIEKTMTDRE